MMRTIFCYLCLSVGLALAQQNQDEFDAPYRLEPIERFSGPLAVRGPGGATRNVRVSIRTWGIPNRQRVTLPEKGYLVVQLVSGEATSITGGQRRERKEGEVWTVPAGQELRIETKGDTAILSIVSVEEQ